VRFIFRFMFFSLRNFSIGFNTAKEKLEIVSGVAPPPFGFFAGVLAACGGEMARLARNWAVKSNGGASKPLLPPTKNHEVQFGVSIVPNSHLFSKQMMWHAPRAW